MAVKPPKTPGYSQDPDAVLDYPFHWADFLADAQDTIVSATVTASTITDDETPLVVAENPTVDGTDVIAWISGGTLGNEYLVTCHIVTFDAREEDQSILIVIQQH